MATLSNGSQLFTSPPPGSGAIMAAILKVCEHLGLGTLSNVQLDKIYEKNEDTYLKLIEAFKFAYAQQTKFGDSLDKDGVEKIRKV